ncbi:MAG TPA: nucleotide pyrophosphohydrolase [Limnobacter sp.]|nr:nucleotide pyrophosphohydrolase [Limnobacter sp.]
MQAPTLDSLLEQLQSFADARDWNKHHSPKNLAMAMVVEAGELVEIFQWQTEEESRRIQANPQQHAHLQDELADVMLYCLRIAQVAGIDPLQAMQNKMHKNAVKYPPVFSK